MKNIVCISSLILCSCVSSFSLATTLPDGWFKTGSNKAAYEVIHDTHDGVPAPSFKMMSNKHATQLGFGTVMQAFEPLEYLGKRVRLTATVKSEDVTGWAGLWVRVEDKNGRVFAFDNMQSASRSITATNAWQDYSIVFNVSELGSKLAYGVILSGAGSINFDDFRFEVVDGSTPISANIDRKQAPQNTQF